MAVTRFLRMYNFGLGFLVVGCSASATTITLLEGDLDNFPAPSATTNRYRIVINREIMEVTGRDEATNKLTVTRGLEGTIAATHPGLALVSLRLTGEGIKRMQDAINVLEQGVGRVQVRIDDAADTGWRPRIHFKSGVGVTVTAVDSETDDEVVVTISSP